MLLLILLLLYTAYGTLGLKPNGGLAVNSPLFANQRALPAVRIDSKGKLSSVDVYKQGLASDLGLPLRDFRVVDPSFPSQIRATFKARPNVILFSLENLKIIVRHDELLIFSPSLSMVQEFIPAIQQQIMALESQPHVTMGRFEHIVLETALSVVCSSLAKRVRTLAPAVTAVLHGLRSQSKGLEVVQTQVDELLPLKNKVDEVDKRIKELKRCVTALYESDEDMQLTYLGPANLPSGAATTIAAQKDEAIETAEMDLEMLLESYVNEIEWISSEVGELMDEITNSEENLVLQLDIIRNRMLRFELLLSISSFVVGTGAFVTGAFGMNLLSHWETRRFMFWKVSAVIIVGMAGIAGWGIRYGRRRNLL